MPDTQPTNPEETIPEWPTPEPQPDPLAPYNAAVDAAFAAYVDAAGGTESRGLRAAWLKAVRARERFRFGLPPME